MSSVFQGLEASVTLGGARGGREGEQGVLGQWVPPNRGDEGAPSAQLYI